MKRTLLFLGAMILASTSSVAQRLVTPKYHPKKNNVEVLASKVSTMKGTQCQAEMADMREVQISSSRHKAPRRTMADEVWYQRPVGSFYVSGSNSGDYWSYLYMPAFADVTYTNMASDKASATWAYIYQGDPRPQEGNEDNNLVLHTPKISNGYISSYYIPQLSVGSVSYTFGENFPNTPDVALINGDTVRTITDVNLSNGYYYGFSNGGSFGNRTAKRTIDGETVDLVSDAIYEFYKKPAKPLCLSDVWFHVVNYEGTPLMNDDTEMKVIIRKIDEEGAIGDVIAEMPFTMDDAAFVETENGKTFGAFVVSQKEEDAFGTVYDVPVIIEDAFVIIISGFEQPDVNFTLYMTGDLKEIETDSFLNNGMVTPTCRSYVRADNGEPVDGLYYCQAITKEQSDQYNKEDGDDYDWTRHYNAVIYLDAMTDVVSLYDGFETMYADPEGGIIYAVMEEENEETGEMEYVAYGTVQYETTLPRISTWEGMEGEDNYEFVDLPDWLKVSEFNDEYYADYDVTLASLEADPLPEGMKGRKAEFRIVSERGADSGIITVIQGEVDDNPVEQLAEGTYYIQNVGTKKFLAAGNSWGTRSIVNEAGLDFTVTAADGKYTIDSQVFNSDVQHFLGSNLYVDSNEFGWTIEGVGNGLYTISMTTEADGVQYLAVGDNNETALVKEVSEAAQWSFQTYEERLAALAAATEAAPVNATFVIRDANFNRNDHRSSAWTVVAGAPNLSGGNNENNNAESYMAAYEITQSVAGLPNGVYKVDAQAAVTFHDNRTVKAYDGKGYPVIFANGQTSNFNVMETADQLTSMGQLSQQFTAGKYAVEPIYIYVTDGTVTVGSKSERDDIWAVWDNFQLTYYGENVSLLEQGIAIDRPTGLGYDVTVGQVDFAQAKAFLGVDELTTSMLRIENPNGELISDYAPFDGWFNGEGVAETWGSNTKVCVKFFQAIPDGAFEICDMNSADEVGKTYTVKWQLVNGEKAVRYNISVSYVAPEAVEIDVVNKDIIASVEYDVAEGDYVEKTVTLSEEQVNAICQELGFSSLAEATVYGYNPTTEELVKNYAGFDGWRDANGDFHNWNQDGTQAPACVKYTDGQNYLCYNRSGQEAQTIKCYWAIANETKAVLVEIDFVYTGGSTEDPELVAPEGWTSVITNGNLAGDDVSNYVSKEYPSTEPTGATIVAGAGMNGSRGIVVKSQDKVNEAWDTQFWINMNEKLPEGTTLHVEFDYRADEAGSVSTQSHGNPGAYQHWAAIGNVNFTADWQHFTAEVTVEGAMADMQSIAMNLNDIATANTYYFDNFGVWIQKPAPVDDWADLLVNGSMEGTEVVNFFSKEAPSAEILPSKIFDGMGKDGSRGIKVESAAGASQDWDSQFWIYLPTTLPQGTKYKVEFDYRADRDASADTQAHAEPGNYIWWSMIGSPSFTTEWQHYEKEGSISADQAEAKTDGVPNGNKFRSVAFNLSKDKENAVAFFFDNVKFMVEKAWYENGIATINHDQLNGKEIYDLRGQKVVNPTKGLYIVNGKKVVIK